VKSEVFVVNCKREPKINIFFQTDPKNMILYSLSPIPIRFLEDSLIVNCKNVLFGIRPI